MSTALITGITGQDGSYLAELLLSKGYEVHGILRRVSSFHTDRINHIFQDPHESNPRLVLHWADIADASTIVNLVHKIHPDEIYHLAAQSHVKVSYEVPEYTGDVTGLGTLRLLEAVRTVDPAPRCYVAASSEMFGTTPPPQNEQSNFHPRSPYACAKVYAYHSTINYREAYGLYAVNGILFNHESPRRGETFVTRKITRAVARIASGLQNILYLGNLDARRDWGYAPEYVEAMWLMLQGTIPTDYVAATGESHSVREFCEYAFQEVGLDWHDYVRVDPNYYRPAEVDHLVGDASKIYSELGWRASVGFDELVRIMVKSDVAQLDDELNGRTVRIDR